jgi:hypothetical protein
MSTITQQPWKMVGIWLALMLVVGAVSFIVWDGPRFIILSKKAATAKGTISSVDKKNHGSVVVIYNVDGINHQATFSPYNRNVEDEVSVYYDPINPNISVIEDPIDLLKNASIASAAAAGILGSFLAFSVFFAQTALRSKHRSLQFLTKPRSLIGGLVLATLIGSTMAIYSNQMRSRLLVAGALILCGLFLALYGSFRVSYEATWKEIALSKTFVFAVLLVICGQMLMVFD